jgi:hypothetical protein
MFDEYSPWYAYIHIYTHKCSYIHVYLHADVDVYVYLDVYTQYIDLYKDRYIDRSFWGEARNIATHVINLTLTVALEGDAPNKVWYDIRDVFYNHLSVFRSKCFVHLPKD